jgi:hypothetical protein
LVSINDSSKDPKLIAIEKYSCLPNNKKDIIHELQVEDILEDDELSKITRGTGASKLFPIRITAGHSCYVGKKDWPTGQTGIVKHIRPVA